MSIAITVASSTFNRVIMKKEFQMPAKVKVDIGSMFGYWRVLGEFRRGDLRYLNVTCTRCNTDHVSRKSHITNGRSTQCLKCYRSNMPSRAVDPEKRLREKITINDNGCHIFTGCVNPDGYGSIAVNSKSTRTHRLAWELKYGPIPKGMLVCHSCDVPNCCNVDHLFLGTNDDNMKDMAEKKRGRSRPGEFSPNAKLTMKDARNIRERYAAGGVSQQTIADEYGVTQRAISLIVRNETYQENPNLPRSLQCVND